MCLGLEKRHYPTGILILLGKFAGVLLSVFSNIPALDGRFFFTPHPLPWGLHNRSTRNLAAPQGRPRIAPTIGFEMGVQISTKHLKINQCYAFPQQITRCAQPLIWLVKTEQTALVSHTNNLQINTNTTYGVTTIRQNLPNF